MTSIKEFLSVSPKTTILLFLFAFLSIIAYYLQKNMLNRISLLIFILITGLWIYNFLTATPIPSKKEQTPPSKPQESETQEVTTPIKQEEEMISTNEMVTTEEQ